MENWNSTTRKTETENDFAYNDETKNVFCRLKKSCLK